MSPAHNTGLVRFCSGGAALALAVVLSGCAHTYNVKVDALHNPNLVAGVSYRIVPKDDVKADFDPNFAAATDLVRGALSSQGMYEAENPGQAAVVVEVDYGIGARRVKLESAPPLPMIQQRQTYVSPIQGRQTPAGNGGSLNQGNNFTTADQVEPQTIRVVTVFEKYLTLSARESDQAPAANRKPAELWRVSVTVEDEDKTVDRCLPVLVAAAADKIGTTTDEREIVRVSEKSDAVLFVKHSH